MTCGYADAVVICASVMIFYTCNFDLALLIMQGIYFVVFQGWIL